MRLLGSPLLLLLLASLPAAAVAGSVAGVCPDGSAFIVGSAADVPCAHAKLMDPSEIPPLRPQLMPRPYKWIVDQEARNPNNPYNLVDEARRIRALRRGEAGAAPPGPGRAPGRLAQGRSEPAQAPPAGGAGAGGLSAELSIGERELRDLVRLIALRQRITPAEMVVETASGEPRLSLQIAWSPAFEQRAGRALPADSPGHLLLFTARASQPVEFYPNFLVTQGGASFRPDPAVPGEILFLVGRPGRLPAGSLALGYLRVPERFDPARPMEIWWNDRHIDATLAAPVGSPSALPRRE
ncbi:MAG: hypothetical protein ACE5IL_00715 [Myxococcota bacterium]